MNYIKTIAIIIFFTVVSCAKNEKSTQQTDQVSNIDRTSPKFERLKYNNPDLVVDLGVGLWAWPLPMDYDGDGDYDLLVSCKDVPYNGIYFFENKSGEAFPAFEPPVKITAPIKNIQASYVDKEPRFLIPGQELADFKNAFINKPKDLFPSDTFDDMHKKIRFNQWKYVDYENDGDLDIIVGIQDGEDYGWDNAFDKNGVWKMVLFTDTYI